MNCLHAANRTQEVTAFINEGYMRLKPLLYPCTIEFSLMCLTVGRRESVCHWSSSPFQLFFLIWENVGKTFAHKISDKASTKNVFMVNCHASIKGLFVGMVIFSCTVISIILYALFRNKIGDDIHTILSSSPHEVPGNGHHHPLHSRAATSMSNTSEHARHPPVSQPPSPGSGPFTSLVNTPKKVLYSIAIVEIVNLCLLMTSLLATTWALMKIRKLQYRRTTTRNDCLADHHTALAFPIQGFDDVLIIVSLTGTYLYTVFSAFALLNNFYELTWIAYLKIMIVFLGKNDLGSGVHSRSHASRR